MILTKLAYSSDKVKGDGMGGCVGLWRRREMHTKFWWEKDEKRVPIQQLVVNPRIVLKQRLKKYSGRKSRGFL